MSENITEKFRTLNRRQIRTKGQYMHSNTHENNHEDASENTTKHRSVRTYEVSREEDDYTHDDIIVDDEAKIVVPLFMKEDRWDNPFFIGKLQFAGSLDLSAGQSFMIFVSEENSEEMQIGPLDPARASRDGEGVSIAPDGRISVRLKKHQDMNGNDFFVGELKGPANIPMHKGMFFTIFTSEEGREELQMKPLNLEKAKRRRQFRDTLKLS